MRIERLIVPAALAGLFAAPALAEDANRFKLEKTNEGYVRMDTQTGAMSICNERDGQLVCRVAADERSAFQDEVDRLQGTIKTLDERVTKLENSLAARLESKLPSEEEFNKTMGYMERFVRGFMGIVKDMEKDGDPTKPGLQKT